MILDELDLEGLPERSFATGESIITENTKVEGLFFLVSGSVLVTKDGVEVAAIDLPGAIFGEMSLLLGCQPTATVTALEPVMMKIVREREEFLARKPDAALHIATILANRLDCLTRYLVDLKGQFGESEDHIGMVDDILDSIMNKHPRKIEGERLRRDLGDH